jgi:hypothetical protein
VDGISLQRSGSHVIETKSSDDPVELGLGILVMVRGESRLGQYLALDSR